MILTCEGAAVVSISTYIYRARIVYRKIDREPPEVHTPTRGTLTVLM